MMNGVTPSVIELKRQPAKPCPFVNGVDDIAIGLREIYDAESYLSCISIECSCGGTMEGQGYLATGKILENGYKPERNELLKIKFIQCDSCGSWQCS